MNWRTRLRVSVNPGDVFFRLTVVEELAAKKHTPAGKVLRTIKCVCECGKSIETPLQRLRSGGIKSCGCLHKDALKAANLNKQAKVISPGAKFGRLFVVSKKGSHTSKCGSVKTVWNLMCDCGNHHVATTGSLTSGNVKSCGCLRFEASTENGRNSRLAIINPQAGFVRAIGGYKRNAKKRGYEFDLTDSQAKVLFESNCHYCGSLPSNAFDVSTYTLGQKTYRYNGIDRRDNTHGYTVTNSVSCCSICNHAKHTLGEAEFKSWILKAANHLQRAIEELDNQSK
jgi:hypothetical protein